MTVLGIILIIVGAVFAIRILLWLGVVLAVIGAVLWIAHLAGRGVGGRTYY